MDDELNGKATQIRVTQGCESRHFIKLFHGKMVVFAGGRASGFKNVHDHDTYDEDGTRLFRIRGMFFNFSKKNPFRFIIKFNL